MKIYNLGIIGLGNWGRNYVQTICRDFPQINLKAACRRSNIRPDFLPPECNFYTDWQDLYRKEKLDGIIVALSPYASLITHDLLCGGIPVMAEKPVCLDSLSWDSIELFAEKTPLLVNYIHCFDPDFIELQKNIDIDRIETILSYGYNHTPPRDFSSLFDYGSHDIAMLLSTIKSYPNKIRCSKEITDNGEQFAIIMDFGKISSYSKVGNGASVKSRKFIVNMDGDEKLIYNDLDVVKFRHRRGEYFILPFPAFNEIPMPLNNAIKHFLLSIDGKYKQNLELTRQTVSILEECDRQVS